MKSVVIVAAGRTPIGSFNGGLSSLTAVELGTQLLKGLLESTPAIKPEEIDEVILGQVLTAGVGQNPARQTSIHAGLPNTVPAYTINKVCASGLKTVQLAAQAIMCGDAKMIVAGGQESMSQAPHVLPNSRTGHRFGDWVAKDTMMSDGLEDAFAKYPMGITAENIAEKYNLSREEQDAFAAASQQKVEQSRGFDDEIIPVSIPQRKGDPIIVSKDEQPRAGVTAESLAKLRPAFKKDGSVTAANSSTINDGAAMVILAEKEYAEANGLPIVAEIVAAAAGGVAPEIMGMGPVSAVESCLKKSNWSADDLDLIEFNEAFAAQTMGVNCELKLPEEKINVRGGAIALGHPIGASGCRILVTLLSELKHRGLSRGIASLCVGGGMGMAVTVKM